MAHEQDRSLDDAARLQHGRYQLGERLGEGGMAVVYEAVDLSTGHKVAVKRLRMDGGERQAAVAALFEREYLALAELKHPRIVEVHEYHVDEQGPYYTMELLDGGDLQRIAPVDYRTACALAHDICSALSLVHSRRMVFRDLSPNNVRRTHDGLAKLIDFGALAPMGPNRAIVGTLPCVAPEAVGFAPLDARTDLFALGATLYFALVRRHAYPGRTIEELVELWKRTPTKPSELVPTIPAALDELVLELLAPDPELRPSGAGEVMERLSTIAGLVRDEQLGVAQAYLATPALVGRDGIIELVRQHATSAKQGQGSSLCLQGVAGVGRSRMLEASGLEAKRLGLLVLRADARDAQSGDFGVVRALVRGLLTQAPTLARTLAPEQRELLARVIPELAEGEPAPAKHEDVQELNRRVQPALRQWFCELAGKSPLVLAIDDLERIDAPSASFVALLARDVASYPMVMLTARTEGVTVNPALQGALHILSRHSTVALLEPLQPAQTQSLLGSLFGEVPNLAVLAQHVQRITRGNARAILGLAEHLVREGIIRYQSGSWTLPEQLSASLLPASMAQAMEQRLSRVSPVARRLCYALSREPSWTFDFDECARLVNEISTALVHKTLNELVALELVEHAGGAYGIAHSVLAASLGSAFAPDELHAVHANLSAVCSARGDMFRAAQHLFRAGDSDEGMRVLHTFAVESVKQTDANPQAYHQMGKNLPADWLPTMELALSLCDKEGRPAREKRALLVRLSGLAAQAGLRIDVCHHVLTLVNDLSRDAGLDCFVDLPKDLDPRARIQTALGRATARFQALPERERVADPVASISGLAKAVTEAVGVVAFTSDFHDWSRIPSLLPLCPLSPTLALVQWLVEGAGLRLGGRCDASLEVYGKLLERLAQPDMGGLPASHHRHMQLRVMGAVAALQASMGLRSSLEYAEKIGQESRFESTMLSVRHLYQLFQGDLREARRIKQQLELLRLESNAHHSSEAQTMFLELAAHALAHDMTGVKRACQALAPYERVHEGVRAAAHYGRAEHNRLRGDAQTALVEIEQALTLMKAGEHLLWAHAAGAHLTILTELGRADEACRLGEVYFQQASGLGYVRNHVRAAWSFALLRSGAVEMAARIAQEAVDELLALGSTGLNVAAACEARARVAAAAGDEVAYAHHAELYARQWPAGNRRLKSTGEAMGHDLVAADEGAEQEALEQLKSTWETCHSVMQRVVLGLEFLTKRSGAEGGALFTRMEGGLVRQASCGDGAEDSALDNWATNYFAREVVEHVTEDVVHAENVHSQGGQSTPGASGKTNIAPVLLGHSDPRGYALTGVVILVGEKVAEGSAPRGIAAALSRCAADMENVVCEYL